VVCVSRGDAHETRRNGRESASFDAGSGRGPTREGTGASSCASPRPAALALALALALGHAATRAPTLSVVMPVAQRVCMRAVAAGWHWDWDWHYCLSLLPSHGLLGHVERGQRGHAETARRASGLSYGASQPSKSGSGSGSGRGRSAVEVQGAICRGVSGGVSRARVTVQGVVARCVRRPCRAQCAPLHVGGPPLSTLTDRRTMATE
jgi:hypothetical protein